MRTSYHSTANKVTLKSRHPCSLAMIPSNQHFCSGSSSWCLAGPSSLFPVISHWLSWFWNTWFIYLLLKQNILTLFCGPFFLCPILSSFLTSFKCRSNDGSPRCFCLTRQFFPWGIVSPAFELIVHPYTGVITQSTFWKPAEYYILKGLGKRPGIHSHISPIPSWSYPNPKPCWFYLKHLSSLCCYLNPNQHGLLYQLCVMAS